MALRGYRKLARLATVGRAQRLLHIASCSHHVGLPEFIDVVSSGIADTDRPARILRIGGAGSDHPIHPLLPEPPILNHCCCRLIKSSALQKNDFKTRRPEDTSASIRSAVGAGNQGQSLKPSPMLPTLLLRKKVRTVSDALRSEYPAHCHGR